MRTVVGISGSLRHGSYNSALLRTAAEYFPADVRLDMASIRDIPLYDGDLEAARFPEPVRQLKDRIAAADGLLLATPEYNHSIPGVFKNTIDWLSRPAADASRVFGHRKVALMGASQSRFGTILSQAAWLPVLATLGMQPWSGASLYVSTAQKVFDASGKLTDDDTRERLKKFVTGFVEFVRQ